MVHIVRFGVIHPNEVRPLEKISKCLSNSPEWLLLAGYGLHNTKLRDIDALLICPGAIICLEFKHWLGTTYASDDRNWDRVLNDGTHEKKSNPLFQALQAKNALRSFLTQKADFDSRKFWFSHAVVLTASEGVCHVSADNPTLTSRVIRILDFKSGLQIHLNFEHKNYASKLASCTRDDMEYLLHILGLAAIDRSTYLDKIDNTFNAAASQSKQADISLPGSQLGSQKKPLRANVHNSEVKSGKSPARLAIPRSAPNLPDIMKNNIEVDEEKSLNEISPQTINKSVGQNQNSIVPIKLPEDDFEIGLFFAKGEGGTIDYPQARIYFEKAAVKDNAAAMFNLGVIYELGLGTLQDYTEALKHYQEADARGNIDAAFNLGNIYEDGRGVPKNFSKAREYFEKAANSEDADAMVSLAVLYHQGLGGPPDNDRAHAWYKRASALGNGDATLALEALRQQCAREAREVKERADEQNKRDREAAARSEREAAVAEALRQQRAREAQQNVDKKSNKTDVATSAHGQHVDAKDQWQASDDLIKAVMETRRRREQAKFADEERRRHAQIKQSEAFSIRDFKLQKDSCTSIPNNTKTTGVSQLVDNEFYNEESLQFELDQIRNNALAKGLGFSHITYNDILSAAKFDLKHAKARVEKFRTAIHELESRAKSKATNWQKPKLQELPVEDSANLNPYVQVLMPVLSPTMEKAKLVLWLKNEGDYIKLNEVIAELETDEVTAEIGTHCEGILSKILVPAGTSNVFVNTPIAIIKFSSENSNPITAPNHVVRPSTEKDIGQFNNEMESRKYFLEGYRLASGQGVAQDHLSASVCFRKAASLGHASSMKALGVLFENGLGVVKHLAQATDWYKSAIDHGDLTAIDSVNAISMQGEKVCYSQGIYYIRFVDGTVEASINNSRTVFDTIEEFQSYMK